MTTRTLSRTLAAAMMLGALTVTAAPVRAEPDSTSLPGVVRLAAVQSAAPARLQARIPALQEAPLAPRPFTLQRGSRGECDAVCALVTSFGGDGREDAVRVRKLAVQLGSGYRLSSSHRLALRPRLQRVRGQEMAGFSVRISGV